MQQIYIVSDFHIVEQSTTKYKSLPCELFSRYFCLFILFYFLSGVTENDSVFLTNLLLDIGSEMEAVCSMRVARVISN